MNAIKSKVTTIANRLVGQGYTRSAAMRRAWELVKRGVLNSRVRGVTFGRSQEALSHLMRYAFSDISITLERDARNKTDSNAVAVIVTVKGKGSYQLGYLPRAFAMAVASLMDAHKTVTAEFQEIMGGVKGKPNFGLAIGISL